MAGTKFSDYLGQQHYKKAKKKKKNSTICDLLGTPDAPVSKITSVNAGLGIETECSNDLKRCF